MEREVESREVGKLLSSAIANLSDASLRGGYADYGYLLAWVAGVVFLGGGEVGRICDVLKEGGEYGEVQKKLATIIAFGEKEEAPKT